MSLRIEGPKSLFLLLLRAKFFFSAQDIRIEGPESPKLLDFFVNQLTAAGLRVHKRVSD